MEIQLIIDCEFLVQLVVKMTYRPNSESPTKDLVFTVGVGSVPSLVKVSKGGAGEAAHAVCELSYPGLSYDRLYIFLVFYGTHLNSVQ